MASEQCLYGRREQCASLYRARLIVTPAGAYIGARLRAPSTGAIAGGPTGARTEAILDQSADLKRASEGARISSLIGRATFRERAYLPGGKR